MQFDDVPTSDVPASEREADEPHDPFWPNKAILRAFTQAFIQQEIQKAIRSFVIRFLTRRFGSLNEMTQARIGKLPVEKLDALFDAGLDFASSDDLTARLDRSESDFTVPRFYTT